MNDLIYKILSNCSQQGTNSVSVVIHEKLKKIARLFVFQEKIVILSINHIVMVLIYWNYIEQYIEIFISNNMKHKLHSYIIWKHVMWIYEESGFLMY